MKQGITLTATEVMVNGKTVATVKNKETYLLLREALYEYLRKDESVFLALTELCETREGVRTSEVANFLSMDRSNCTKALERLLEQERIRVVGSSADDEETSAGRPSRLWAVA